MAITLARFASGDLDYIAKLNSDMATVEAAINNLQMAQSGAGQTYTIPIMLDVLFESHTGLIGAGSYKPTVSGKTLQVAKGGAYLSSSQSIVQGVDTTLNFTSLPAATYYINLDSTGQPTRSDTFSAQTSVYQIDWNGASFTGITRLVKAIADVDEQDDARISTTLDTTYPTLDDRLETVENTAQSAKDTAESAQSVADEALTLAYEGSIRTRKVGATVTATGVAGAIQVDFAGRIIGWSVIADAAGTLSVDVCKRSSSAPPAHPAIPNTTTHKISASAPIKLTSQQSASASEAEVETWDTDVNPWDVLLFNVTGLTVTKATLYVRILQL